MEVIETLKAQHRLVEQLFEETEKAKAPEAKERLFRDLTERLSLHMELEESIFYPCVSSVNDDLVTHSYAEHAAVRPLLEELMGLKGDDPLFLELLIQARKLVEEHVAEEEGVLFPACLDALDPEVMSELSVEIEESLNGMGGAGPASSQPYPGP